MSRRGVPLWEFEHNETFDSSAKSRVPLDMSTRPSLQTLFLDFPLWDGRYSLREHRPVSTIPDLLVNQEACNKRLIWRTRPSSDPVLDEEAWSKTAE